jgi:hypothetical protein
VSFGARAWDQSLPGLAPFYDIWVMCWERIDTLWADIGTHVGYDGLMDKAPAYGVFLDHAFQRETSVLEDKKHAGRLMTT